MHKQCEDCVYRGLIGGGNPSLGYCCHHILETGRRREIGENDECLSKVPLSENPGKKRKAGWGWDD